MKYAIDRIENNIAICQNLETREEVEISLNCLPTNIKDGTIIVFKENKYEIDLNEEELRRRKLRERFNKLKNN